MYIRRVLPTDAKEIFAVCQNTEQIRRTLRMLEEFYLQDFSLAVLQKNFIDDSRYNFTVADGNGFLRGFLVCGMVRTFDASLYPCSIQAETSGMFYIMHIMACTVDTGNTLRDQSIRQSLLEHLIKALGQRSDIRAIAYLVGVEDRTLQQLLKKFNFCVHESVGKLFYLMICYRLESSLNDNDISGITSIKSLKDLDIKK